MPPAHYRSYYCWKSTKPDATLPFPTNNNLELPESFHNSQTGTTSSDPISMGAKIMLDEAGRIPKTIESYDVFIQGKTRTDKFLKLDLEQDHVSLT